MTIPRGWRTWMRPGMHVKRWAALFLLGTVLTGLSIAMGLVYSYRYTPFPEPLSTVIQVFTLQFLPRELRFVIVFATGLASCGTGSTASAAALIQPVLAHAKANKDLVEIVAEHRFGLSRPEVNVVAIGGGTGLSYLLRGLKQHEVALTAIVTVADDGGSTGKIRNAYDIPAPGDIRNCLVALADDESLVSRLFQYRFNQAGLRARWALVRQSVHHRPDQSHRQLRAGRHRIGQRAQHSRPRLALDRRKRPPRRRAWSTVR